MSNQEKSKIYKIVNISGEKRFRCINCHSDGDKPFSECAICGLKEDTLNLHGTISPAKLQAFRNTIAKISTRVVSLLVAKREYYGTNFEDSWDEFGMVSVVMRINDKINRLKNLIKTSNNPKEETIEDTFMDIIGYCLLSLRKMSMEKKKEKE